MTSESEKRYWEKVVEAIREARERFPDAPALAAAEKQAVDEFFKNSPEDQELIRAFVRHVLAGKTG
jgi:hypothetical protein